MTPEQRKGVVEFLRKFVRLTADFTALVSIVNEYEKNREIPLNWQNAWSDLQKSEEYKASIGLYEPLFVAAERATSETDLIALIHKISETPQPN
jgi:hypothetical protein